MSCLYLTRLVILSGAVCREGPMHFADAGRMHRFFASLRMTNGSMSSVQSCALYS
jgi:hypothetical protein